MIIKPLSFCADDLEVHNKRQAPLSLFEPQAWLLLQGQVLNFFFKTLDIKGFRGSTYEYTIVFHAWGALKSQIGEGFAYVDGRTGMWDRKDLLKFVLLKLAIIVTQKHIWLSALR